jgi:hypothetical protein
MAKDNVNKPNIFMLPNGNDLKNAFQAVAVETQAVPNYTLDKDVNPKQLANFHEVLLGLASPDLRKDNRNAIFPTDVEEHLSEPVTPSQRNAFDVIEGKSVWGFNIAAVAAGNDVVGRTYFFVIEDTVRERMMVIADLAISAELERQLAAGGVDYTYKLPPKSASRIDDFLVEGAKVRGERGMMKPSDAQTVVEDLITGFSVIQQIGQRGSDEIRIEKGATLGSIIKQNDIQPDCYTNIMKPGLKK